MIVMWMRRLLLRRLYRRLDELEARLVAVHADAYSKERRCHR